VLEHIPQWLGAALKGIRAGADALTIAQPGLGHGATINLSSPAFANEARLPSRFTADGEGVSPPLVWGATPDGTAMLALLVEDPRDRLGVAGKRRTTGRGCDHRRRRRHGR
jgi:hypothetical protein